MRLEGVHETNCVDLPWPVYVLHRKIRLVSVEPRRAELTIGVPHPHHLHIPRIY
jgi:hypothetical protein